MLKGAVSFGCFAIAFYAATIMPNDSGLHVLLSLVVLFAVWGSLFRLATSLFDLE